jgi:hypothetical protein
MSGACIMMHALLPFSLEVVKMDILFSLSKVIWLLGWNADSSFIIFFLLDCILSYLHCRDEFHEERS